MALQTQPSQAHMYYNAVRKEAELNLQFLEFVNDGLTREELQTNINRRPALWGRWSAWLDKLPSSKAAVN